mmetsp:Transcript_88168/g.248068  ORF Transcript_88168/g.248068 Transcript_88168/m.248068 type:complete len:277 (+) Transcript_88168:87-917(+)
MSVERVPAMFSRGYWRIIVAFRGSGHPALNAARRVPLQPPKSAHERRRFPEAPKEPWPHKGPFWYLAGAATASAVALPVVVACGDDGSDSDSDLPGPWKDRLGDGAERLDTRRWEEALGRRTDRQLVWHTCSGPGGIQSCKSFVCAKAVEVPDSAASSTESLPGLTRVCTVLRVGDALNGHIGLLHGGFAAALMDEFTAVVSFLEKDKQDLGKDAQIFTARLVTNYRRPTPCNSEYLLDVWVDRIEKRKKIFVEAVLYDQPGAVCVDASALYIVKC